MGIMKAQAGIPYPRDHWDRCDRSEEPLDGGDGPAPACLSPVKVVTGIRGDAKTWMEMEPEAKEPTVALNANGDFTLGGSVDYAVHIIRNAHDSGMPGLGKALTSLDDRPAA